jgi:hypothetical protein
MEFCENTKGSVDIDSWTFNELVEVLVILFRLSDNSFSSSNGIMLASNKSFQVMDSCPIMKLSMKFSTSLTIGPTSTHRLKKFKPNR